MIDDLDQYVTLQQSVMTTGAGGRTTRGTWTAVASDLAASIKPLTGWERYLQQQVKGGTTHKIAIRKPVENVSGTEVRPTTAMRLLHESTRIFEIVAPPRDIDEAGFYYIIDCRETE